MRVSDWAGVGDGDLAGDALAVHSTEAEVDGEAVCGHEVSEGERIVLTAEGGWVCEACAPKPGATPATPIITQFYEVAPFPKLGDCVFERRPEPKVPPDWSARFGVVVRTGRADGRDYVEALEARPSDRVVTHRLFVDQLDPARTRPANASTATEMTRRICRFLGMPRMATCRLTRADIDMLYAALALVHDHVEPTIKGEPQT